jgi:hypothetical protein
MSTDGHDSPRSRQIFSCGGWAWGIAIAAFVLFAVFVEARFRAISLRLAGAQTSQLHEAVLHRPQDIPILVRYGRDPNRPVNRDFSGSSPLELAVHSKRPASVVALLQNGADPNRPTRSRQSLLEFLCMFSKSPGHYEMASMLLQAGADPNRSQGKTSPLILACCGSVNPNLVRLLLEHGADPTLADERGRTALHEAATWADDATVQLLLDRGADPLALDHHGRAPFEWNGRTNMLLDFAARRGRLPEAKPGFLSTKQWTHLVELADEARLSAELKGEQL